MTHTVLFELGCEELPPKSLKTLRDALKSEVETRLQAAGLTHGVIHAYAAPRRLALLIEDLADRQADRVDEKRGPAAVAGFDADGKPTRALEGFMRGAGISVEQLSRIDTPKGEWLVYRQTISGRAMTELLPGLLQDALDALPIAKRMRSAASRTEFVRPVQWVVLMRDAEVIPATLQDFATGNTSYGHRFHAPQPIVLAHARDYVQALAQAHVLVDFEQRQQRILQQTEQLADDVGARALTPPELLDEVTALVEWPVALRARFEERFLAVPQEALISTMQDNQKYFCLVDAAGKLQPYFITISNIASRDPAQIIAGNEKVVRPRLTDAEFFFKQDQKQRLEQRQDKLEQQVFQAQLGTLWDKTQRIARLAALIASQTGAHAAWAERAGLLSKMDLATELVGEFPELQGIAGSYYAAAEGEPAEVATALREQYLPRFAGDALPQTQTGTALALADRLDTLAGIFGINQPPTGNKDPFSLRRASIGALRLMIEKQLSLPLDLLLAAAIQDYGPRIADPEKTLHAVMEFMKGRYRAMYEDQGMAVDTIQAVQALNPHSPLDFDRRIRAVQQFRTLPDAEALAAANKRVANILAKEKLHAGAVNADLLIEAAERGLYDVLEGLEPQVKPLLEAQDYSAALTRLAALRTPVDHFFDTVMVMAEDPALRHNRLQLLARLRALFLSVADVSVLQG